MGAKQQYSNEEMQTRREFVDEILEWIESETETKGRITYSPSSEMIIEHMKKMVE